MLCARGSNTKDHVANMAEAGKDVRRQYDELAFDNFFQRFSLVDLKDLFIENGFRTCRSLMIVTDDDLKEIGIASLGLRKEVLGAVEEWRKPLLQRTGSSAPDRNQKTTPITTSQAQSPSLTQHTSRSPPDSKERLPLQSPSPGQFVSPVIARVRESPGQGSPSFVVASSPSSPGAERFHRIKRNESCPYPECTWAGLSTHFHCLICSSFHTNKMGRVRKHLKAHSEAPYDAETNQRQEEYYQIKETQFTIFNKFCPDMCKYAQQGIRHIHCKHCEWKTQKFDSRLLAHFKSHHERLLLQYQSSQELGSPVTTMANIRTVSPLPTMAVQEAVQVADAHAANHDGSSLPRPPKLMKMDTPDGERAVAVHMQQSGYMNRANSEEEGTDASMAEGEVSQHSSRYKCMVCGETQGLRSALMREQKGRNGPVDWSKTKQLFAYHRTKTTQPGIQWICQKHIEEFVYFSRAYLSLWSTAGVHQQLPAPSHHHQQPQHLQQQQQQRASPENEGEVNENTLVSGMPVYLMLNEHLNEQFKTEPVESTEEVGI
ncbi:uncharacterized protein LOC135683114 isoform X2 [Rhopilema esculentum]|uniref:uncharacterized protein LOC135683114 isoform X2 n=1 Tax=Rhopilema esculentum TaxID=499914 RepID=UPI0031CF984A